MEGEKTQALVDSMCDQTCIWERIAKVARKLKKGKIPIRCIHGDILQYLITTIRLTVDGHQGQMRECVSTDLRYPEILGWDWL